TTFHWLLKFSIRACSSAGEHYVDIVGVTGSIPVTPTIPPRNASLPRSFNHLELNCIRLTGRLQEHACTWRVCRRVHSCNGGHAMATTILTDKESIRDWAAARMGFPVVVDTSVESGIQPMLRIVFDQAAYQDQDMAERPQN